MAEINAKQVKELRDRTVAGVMGCKKALQDADGDTSQATLTLNIENLDDLVSLGGLDVQGGEQVVDTTPDVEIPEGARRAFDVFPSGTEVIGYARPWPQQIPAGRLDDFPPVAGEIFEFRL